MYHSYLPEEISPTLQLCYQVSNRTLMALTDLLTANTLIYLFYVSSMAALSPSKDRAEAMAEAMLSDIRKMAANNCAGGEKRPEYNTQEIRQLLEGSNYSHRYTI